MKILILNHGAFPYNGGNGCSVQLNSIITSFFEAGHKLNLCNINTSYPINDEVECVSKISKKVHHINIIPLIPDAQFKKPQSLSEEIKFTIIRPKEEFYNGYSFQDSIDKIIVDWKPDLIFAYTINALTTYNYNKHKIPYAISSIDLDSLVHKYKYIYRNNQGIKHKIKLFLRQIRAKKLDKILVRYANNSIVCFEHAAHHANYLTSKGCKYVKYYPVNVLEPEQTFHYPAFNPSNIKIGLLGNVTGIATISGLIDLFRNYMPKFFHSNYYKNTQFIIIGGGELSKYLQSETSTYPNISRLGYVDNQVDIYKMTDIILVPTPIPLGFRTRIVEAFSYGAIVITHKANADAMPEFVHKKNGLVYSNYEEFEQCFKLLNDHPEKNAGHQESARQTFRNELRGEIIGKKMLQDISENLIHEQ